VCVMGECVGDELVMSGNIKTNNRTTRATTMMGQRNEPRVAMIAAGNQPNPTPSK